MECQIAFITTFIVFLATCNAQLTQEQIRQATLKARRLPGLDVCGKSSVFDIKIINGQPAELGAFPWMANLGFTLSESDPPRWLCGGSLVTDQYVITAAHCVAPSIIQKKRPYQVRWIRLGDLDLDPDVADGATPRDFRVQKIEYHEEYDNDRKINDIALIRMREKVTFTALIKPICLPPPVFQSNMFIGYYPIVAGWGKSVANSVGTGTRLLQTEVEIKENDSCGKNITTAHSSLKNAIVDQRVLCASSPGKDSCQGDSGGPLMFYRKLKKNPMDSNGNMFLMGIVSYGYGCALEGYPGVYTRVSEYMSWIIDHLDI